MFLGEAITGGTQDASGDDIPNDSGGGEAGIMGGQSVGRQDGVGDLRGFGNFSPSGEVDCDWFMRVIVCWMGDATLPKDECEQLFFNSLMRTEHPTSPKSPSAAPRVFPRGSWNQSQVELLPTGNFFHPSNISR